ncbi:MAG: bifunctional 2-polyprenyl-6-hydroxyphenol methylase/3-demethylubiquinol 3-O-methyltransferase UbiG, partial [Pseudomonadota bacterium]
MTQKTTTKPVADAASGQPASNVDAAEVERFSKLASEWWNPNGKFKPLHKFNPVRLEYIRDSLARHYDRDIESEMPLKDLSILDIGCGGGLLCEPLARLGADVTGIEPSRANIDAAKQHAVESGLDINYRVTTAEGLSQQAELYDVVLAMEVIEHVPDPDAFIA